MFFIDYHQFADKRHFISLYKKLANVLNKFDSWGLKAVGAYGQTISGMAFLLCFKPKRGL